MQLSWQKKQVAEERNKQYYVDNEKKLEDEYLMLLKESSASMESIKGIRNETYKGDIGESHKLIVNKSRKDNETGRGKTRWWHRLKPSSLSDSEKVLSRQSQKLENIKRKAKEKAIREAKKVALDYRPVMSKIIADYLFRCPSWQYAHSLSFQRINNNEPKRRESKQDNRNNIFVYRFSQPTHIPGFQECWGKSCHTAELPYVFKAMDVIRSNYSTLSFIAQDEAPVTPEYPYTDLINSYKHKTASDARCKNDGLGPKQHGCSSSTTFPWQNQLSNYTSRFQHALRHFFGDYFHEDADEETAYDMARRWVAFSRSGNPNHEESKVQWMPWRHVDHHSSDGESMLWGKDDRKQLFNIWRDVEESVMHDLGKENFRTNGTDVDDGGIEDDDRSIESKIGQAFRKRALEVLNMEVAEEDSLRTELKRNRQCSSISGDNPLRALRSYLSRWNMNSSVASSCDINESTVDYDMIQKIQQMAQEMGVLGRGLDGNKQYNNGAASKNDADFGNRNRQWDDFFPQFIDFKFPPEGRLIERDCSCDFWARIGCKYIAVLLFLGQLTIAFC